jgi:hypothetical protein
MRDHSARRHCARACGLSERDGRQDGDPYFRDVCARVLNRDASIPITFVGFDVLRIDGENTMDASFEARRAAARPYDGRTERREGRR